MVLMVVMCRNKLWFSEVVFSSVFCPILVFSFVLFVLLFISVLPVFESTKRNGKGLIYDKPAFLWAHKCVGPTHVLCTQWEKQEVWGQVSMSRERNEYQCTLVCGEWSVTSWVCVCVCLCKTFCLGASVVLMKLPAVEATMCMHANTEMPNLCIYWLRLATWSCLQKQANHHQILHLHVFLLCA